MSDKIKFLNKILFFTDLHNDDLLFIENIMRQRQCKKNTLLFSQGDPGEAIYFVISGKVKIFKTSEDGKEHTLTIAAPGDIFAEVVLFNEVHYPATAEVIEDGIIAYIRNADMEKVLQVNPKIAVAIIKALNKRLIESQSQVERLAFQDARSRTAEVLLNLVHAHGKQTPFGIELDLGLSRQELANMVGVTRETFTRALMLFKKMKVIEISGQVIMIKDVGRLESWA
jgi:CRP/FNR family transcriptional regulator